MIRSLLRTLGALVIGALIGGTFAGLPGAALGAVLLGCLGLLWISVEKAGGRVPEGAETRREQHRLLCMPQGQMCEVEVVRDVKSGRFVDVESCSLRPGEEKIHCAKKCLVLMNDVARHEPPGEENAVESGEPAEEAASPSS